MVRPASHSTNPSIASVSTTASSSVGSVYFLPQYMHIPDPEYISVSGAISTVQEFLVDAGNAHHVLSRDIVVTPMAVQTVNFFLDYILHEILARTRSTALSRLRDGVALVIRTTLGTSAMASAEQELLDHAYVGDAELDGNPEDGTDEDELEVKWDLDKVWARARIICMVYSILGDKEQDDFEEYEEDPDTQIPASQKLSTAAAIYLAAVLETVASHCLRVGGRAALHRFTHHHGTTADPMHHSALLNVEDADIKRGIVEDDLTTRLWRKWKRSENVASTILPYSVHFDAMRNGTAETSNHLLSSNSRLMSRRFSNPTAVQPAPTTSTNRLSASGERRHKHRLSRPDLATNNENLTDIKGTLAERGVASPESPKEQNVEYFGRESSSTRPVSYDSIRILTPPIVNAQDVEDDLPTPRPVAKIEEDPLKTPTTHTVKFAAETKGAAEPEAKKTEEFVVGGVDGFSFSIWETETPVNEKFYYAAKTVKDEQATQMRVEEAVPASSRPNNDNADSNVDVVPDFDEQSIEHVAVSSLQGEQEAPEESSQPSDTPTPEPPKPTPSPREASDAETNVLPGTWSKSDARLPLTEDPIAEEESEEDASDAGSDHVNDRIANQFAELERDQAVAAQVGLGLGDITTNGMSSVVVHNLVRGAPVYPHTELTPIIEHSGRESIGSEVEDYATPPVVPPKGSPPPTRQSQGSNRSPSRTNSTHSADRRSSSLTSQAERLRNKFLNRKAPLDSDLTIETGSAGPEEIERKMRFESLIRSGETMKMTLTPTSLRSIEDDLAEQRTVPARVLQQAAENSTRELADFLRSTGPESFLGGTTYERRGSLPTNPLNKTPNPANVRSVPSTPALRNNASNPPHGTHHVPSKYVPRSPVGADPEHSTLQLAAFIRTTGPDEPVPRINRGNRSNHEEKHIANSIHSTGDSSTTGLLKYQSLQSQRYPPSPSTSTAYGNTLDEYEDSDDDLELSLYPGARRKHKNFGPKEESLVDFLRNTSPPEPTLPPSPTTPQNLRHKLTGSFSKKGTRGNMKSPEPLGRANMKSPEPSITGRPLVRSPEPRAVDIFDAVRSVQSPTSPAIRAMSPTPSARTAPPATSSFNQLNVNLPSGSLMSTSEDYFSEHGGPGPLRSKQNPDEILPVKRTQSICSSATRGAARDPVMDTERMDSLATFLRNTGPSDFVAGPQQLAGKQVKKSKSGFFRRFVPGNNPDKARVQRSGSVSSGGRFTPITIPAIGVAK